MSERSIDDLYFRCKIKKPFEGYHAAVVAGSRKSLLDLDNTIYCKTMCGLGQYHNSQGATSLPMNIQYNLQLMDT